MLPMLLGIIASAIGGREFDHPEIVQAIRKLLGK